MSNEQRILEELVKLKREINRLKTVEIPRGGGGGGGVTDHGMLTGLGDDDHTQYLTDSRGDARYIGLTGDQSVAGTKTFSAFPITPSSAPTLPYQVANKGYVDNRTKTKTLIITCVFAEDDLIPNDSTPVRTITVPIELNGAVLTNVAATIYTASSSGLPEFRVYNGNNAENMLSTNITIDVSELTSYTAATQPVIDDAEKTVATGDRLSFYVKTAGTGAKGLDIILTFEVQ